MNGTQQIPNNIPCPPGCTQYTPEQGCTYHGTLPTGFCEPHVVKNCPECNEPDESIHEPLSHFGNRTYDPTADRARLAAAECKGYDGLTGESFPMHTRPVTVPDAGFGGQDMTYEAEAIAVYLTGKEWQQVIDNLSDAVLGLIKDITEQVRRSGQSSQACTYSFIEGRHLRRCPIGYTPDQEGLTE